MKKRFICFTILILMASLIFADFQDTINQADTLYSQENYARTTQILEDVNATGLSNIEKTQLYWRLSRVYHAATSRIRDNDGDKNTILDGYATGEDYASMGIAAAGTSHRNNDEAYLAYYWRSACVGSWGQVKGILDSLAKAKPMKEDLINSLEWKDDFGDSYLVLGILYEALPGGFISFGNKDFSVSYGRAAVDFMLLNMEQGIRERIDYDFYVELASHLYARNWNSSKRNRSQSDKLSEFNDASSAIDKYAYYEGTLEIPNMSDKNEALEILNTTIRTLQSIDRDTHDDNILEKALELKEEWD